MGGALAAKQELVNECVARLSELLGPEWQVRAEGVSQLVLLSPEGERAARGLLIVETVRPRWARDNLGPFVAMSPDALSPLMVLTRSLTSRSKDTLRDLGIDYLDLAGNVRLRVAKPTIVVETTGQQRPRDVQARTDSVTLAGPRAARLVRLLVDVAPPYRSTGLAKSSGLSAAYVSRLLRLLDEQLLITRQSQLITEVDWPGLLRARSAVSTLLRHNPATTMLAPNGVPDMLERFSGLGAPWAITGHYAAREVAPVASGGQLMVYLPRDTDPLDAAERLGLLPAADAGADVLLLRAQDPVVFHRTRAVNGHPHVALSQLVLDALSGPGRLPAEGEAVLESMIGNEARWRHPAL